MATFHDRTLAPKFQGRVLRGAGPCRVLTSDEMITEVKAADACHGDTPTLSPTDQPENIRLAAIYPDEIGLVSSYPVHSRLAAARALHSRRALERAADHGVALLAALNLPHLVRADIGTPDAAEIGDALDMVIAHLDALDAPDEDREPYLAGWFDPKLNLGGEREAEEEHDEDDNLSEAEPDKEPSLGWPNDLTAVTEHRFEATDYDVEAVNEDDDDCGEAYAPWWDRIGYWVREGVHA